MSDNQMISGTCEGRIPYDDDGTHAGAYVLMTAAYNEEEDTEYTILSVISQTNLSRRLVVVSDCSTDKTDAIVQSYETKHASCGLQQTPTETLPPNRRSVERKSITRNR
jgi:glycosyltransferase involved in cell wall biosynthesis